MKITTRLTLASLLVSTLITAATLNAKKADPVDQWANALLRDPIFEYPKLSPDGSHILTYFTRNNIKNIATYNLDKKKGRSLAAGRTYEFNNATWIDGDNILVQEIKWGTFYSDCLCLEQNLIRKEKKIGYVQDVYNRFYNAGGDTYRKEGNDHIFSVYDGLPYSTGEAILKDRLKDKNDYLELWRTSQNGKNLSQLIKKHEHVIDADFDLQGNLRIKVIKGEKAEQRLYYHRWKDDSPWEILPFTSKVYFRGFDLSGKIAYVVHQPQDKQVTQAFNLETKQFEGEVYDDPDYGVVADILRMPNTGEPVGLSYQADKLQAVYWNPKVSKLMGSMQKILPEMSHKFLGFRDNGNLIFSSFSDTQPTILHQLNVQKRTVERILVEYPDIDPAEMASMTPFSCKTRDGATIRGYYTLPPEHAASGNTAFPTIVKVHGGPRSRDYWGFDPEIQFYAQLGYAVLQVNYRGSYPMYQDHYYTLTDCCKLAVDDVADATRWFIDQGYAKADKVAIYGWSFGGYTALASVARYPDLYQCAIGAGGVYDWQRLIKHDKEDYSDIMEWRTDFWGDIDEKWDEYAECSPINQVNKITVPIYLLHGNDDGIVGASQSKKMYGALKEAGVDAELDTPGWVGHGLYREESTRLKYVRRMYDFLAEHLK